MLCSRGASPCRHLRGEKRPAVVGEGNMVGDRGGVGVWRWRIFISNCSLSAIY